MADYSLDEVSTICGEIKRRVKGGMTDEEFQSFNKVLMPPGMSCKQCEDTGAFHDGGGMTVCRRCDYHRKKGRTLSIREPESVWKARK